MKQDSFKSVRNKALKNGGHISPAAGGDNAPSSFQNAAAARLEANLGKSPFASTYTYKPSKDPNKPVEGTKPARVTRNKTKW